MIMPFMLLRGLRLIGLRRITFHRAGISQKIADAHMPLQLCSGAPIVRNRIDIIVACLYPVELCGILGDTA